MGRTRGPDRGFPAPPPSEFPRVFALDTHGTLVVVVITLLLVELMAMMGFTRVFLVAVREGRVLRLLLLTLAMRLHVSLVIVGENHVVVLRIFSEQGTKEIPSLFPTYVSQRQLLFLNDSTHRDFAYSSITSSCLCACVALDY